MYHLSKDLQAQVHFALSALVGLGLLQPFEGAQRGETGGWIEDLHISANLQICQHAVGGRSAIEPDWDASAVIGGAGV
ncbi:MAG: hypothetical protein PVH62_01380 [Anaerolineae bacterium]|jgi:hypothetical protein